MKYSLLLIAFLTVASVTADETPSSNITINCENAKTGAACSKPQTQVIDATGLDTVVTDVPKKEDFLAKGAEVRISVIGQGVAPMNTSSPAQAYALAKRAATADAYRLLAEKVKGVRIDGQDLIKNMMVQRSTVRTTVQAMVKNANVVETTFKEGLCEVEMEIVLAHAQFSN
ncbi:MAG: LPP20 family lipoprotein [Sulfurimonas sp.]|nr:LPP20 family lipoprotein [Sulfurimonas sp.]MDD5202279.1 LPP20 family lipoprotein [Sulfurimonas sp.]